jgi:hypothetical protein
MVTGQVTVEKQHFRAISASEMGIYTIANGIERPEDRDPTHTLW